MDRVENRFKYPKHEGMKFSKDNPRQRSRTIVSMAKECNVNEIIRKYKKTGQVPHPFDPSGVGATPIYGDFSSGADFNAIQNTVVAVRSAFDSLPAAIRARFGHDPAQLLDFVNDPSNVDECIKLGLVAPKPAPITLPNGNDKVVPGVGESNIPAEPPAVGPTS